MGRTRSALVTGALSVALAVASGASGPAASAEPVPLAGVPLPSDVIAASSAPGGHWRPGPARYGIGEHPDVSVRMSDGTTLRADVYYPTGSDGAQADGRFPVVLTLTPYGRRMLGAAPEELAGAQSGGPNAYLVRRGYISVTADVRGTGGSEGAEGALANPRLAADGATLVDWAAKLPGSNGKVGMYGGSYLGATQLLTASAVGRNSPLKAIFPIVAPNDTYKDFITMGGLINIEIDAAFPGLLGSLSVAGPAVNAVENPQHVAQSLNPAEPQHLANLAQTQAPFGEELLTGGPVAYDDAYWQPFNPGTLLDKIVDNGVAAYVVGGEYDVFQRGPPLNYVGLQNAWAGRPVDAPMLPDQRTTGRYQLLDGPFGHLAGVAADLSLLQLEWFDTFLKGEDTGMDRTPTPLHYYDLGTHRYAHGAHYPFPQAKATRFYLSGERSGSAPLSRNDGTLSTAPPRGPGADPLPWSPVGNPCGRPVDQWSFGAISAVTQRVTHSTPCIDNDAPGTIGTDRLTYSSPPLDEPRTIAGPITMTVYATANTRDTEWVAELEDVAPDGKSTPLTEGALLGSFRRIDPATTWRAPDDEIIQAGHTYSRTSVQPVVPGRSTRYDIEVLPSYTTVARSHRIRVTLSTADTPHLLPTVPALRNLLGGIYAVQHAPDAASAIELPLIPGH